MLSSRRVEAFSVTVQIRRLIVCSTKLYWCVQNMLTACLAVQHPHLTFLMLHPGWVQTDMGGAGGRTADIGVEESVAGIYKVVGAIICHSNKRTLFFIFHIQVFSEATPEMSGKFLDWRGQEIPF